MPTLSRLLGAITALLTAGALLGVEAPAVGASAPAMSPATGTAAAAAGWAAAADPVPDEGRHIDLHGDATASGALARGGFRKWRLRTLYYYETMPTKWDWSLSTAVAKWNAAGAGIKLVRTTSRSRARLTISYGYTGGAAGMATVGATRGAWIHLNPEYSRVNAYEPWHRVGVMALFAHEIGHVMGFGHTTPKCSLMHPVLWIDDCGYLYDDAPGYYRCKILDTTLVSRFVRIYGGRARHPSATRCLIEALPTSLTGVVFGGGAGSPVTVAWARPATVPAGSRVLIRFWEAGSCADPPGWWDEVRVLPTSLLWRDTAATWEGAHCYTAQLVNRYGAGRTVFSSVRQRWVAPPAAPTIGAAVHDAGLQAFTFPATWPDRTSLVASWDPAAPTTCAGTYDWVDDLWIEALDDGRSRIEARAPQMCVAFFAVNWATGKTSAPVHRTFTRP